MMPIIVQFANGENQDCSVIVELKKRFWINERLTCYLNHPPTPFSNASDHPHKGAFSVRKWPWVDGSQRWRRGLGDDLRNKLIFN